MGHGELWEGGFIRELNDETMDKIIGIGIDQFAILLYTEGASYRLALDQLDCSRNSFHFEVMIAI